MTSPKMIEIELSQRESTERRKDAEKKVEVFDN
jgi:hypothetical protein